MHKHARITLAVAVVATALLIPLHASAEGVQQHEATVQNGYYSPNPIVIGVKDTVQWTWASDGHSVTGPGFDSRTLDRGATFKHTFTEPGTFEYGCVVHPGMTGKVHVGPQPEPPVIESPTIHVPSEVATLAMAVEAAPSGATIRIDAGDYALADPVVVDKPLTITAGRPPSTTTDTTSTKKGQRRGVPTTTTTTIPMSELSAEDVVLRAEGAVNHGIVVTSPGVNLQRLTIRDFRVSAVRLEPPEPSVDLGYVMADLRLLNNLDYGLEAVATSGRITGVFAEGSRRAGISLRSCDPCGYVEGLDVTGNFVGVEVIDGHGATITRSNVHGNGNGVVAQSRAVTTDGATVQLFDNRIIGNARTDVPSPTLFQEEGIQPAAGAGVWLAGTHDAVVEGNTVQDQRYGVVATAFASPTVGGRVARNLGGGADQTDLAWDGAGAGLCFEANTRGVVSPTSSPLLIETLYPCGGGANVGVANPVPLGDLALASLRTYYCRELAACPPSA